ncbi:hypothetical protein V492_03223 [Pseudogymnoascus sp. VKM F-4246]|nr:hypothetical protein V492_03223 [Pseudogymnoascus sp. VKM F-4246]
MAQEVADPIRTVPQRAAANLDPKTRRVSRVKVGFGRGVLGGLCSPPLWNASSPKTATMGLRPFERNGTGQAAGADAAVLRRLAT